MQLDNDEIKELLSRPEDGTFDRVRSLENKDSVGEKIAAFATVTGGTLLIGQDDQKNAIGIGSSVEDFLGRLGHILEQLDPKPTIEGPQFIQLEEKTVAMLKIVSLGSGGPCCYKDTAYRRVLDRSEKIPPKELHRLWSSAGKLHFEERPTNAPLSAVDREELDFYAQEAKKNASFDEEKFLLARKLAVKKGDEITLTNLGTITLARSTQDWLSPARVHLVRFKGITPG